MGTGISIRSVQPASFITERVAPPVDRQAVASELPEAQAVSAVAETAPVRLSTKSEEGNLRAELNKSIDRKTAAVIDDTVSQIVQDTATKELIFRKVKSDTGQVVGQYPDEAILRLRAYNAQLRRAEIDAVQERVA